MRITIDIPTDECIDELKYFNSRQQLNDAYMADPCKQCPNNPKNGGSGICNCTLPYMYGPNRVTCSTVGSNE